MSLKRICAAVALATLFASCTHVGTKVGNLSKGGFTTIVVDAGHGAKTTAAPVEGDQFRFSLRRI
jgi:hypothetical protein